MRRQYALLVLGSSTAVAFKLVAPAALAYLAQPYHGPTAGIAEELPELFREPGLSPAATVWVTPDTVVAARAQAIHGMTFPSVKRMTDYVDEKNIELVAEQTVLLG